jgi:hypothetical protein
MVSPIPGTEIPLSKNPCNPIQKKNKFEWSVVSIVNAKKFSSWLPFH